MRTLFVTFALLLATGCAYHYHERDHDHREACYREVRVDHHAGYRGYRPCDHDYRR